MVTPVARPIGVSWNMSLTALAASPSTPLSTATLIAPSRPVKTWVLGIVGPLPYWRFMVTRMKSIENVGCSVITTARCPGSPARVSR